MTLIKRVGGYLAEIITSWSLWNRTCHWGGGCLKRMSLFQNRLLELYFTPSEDQVGVGNNLIFKDYGTFVCFLLLIMEKYSQYRWFSILPLSSPPHCLLKDSEAATCWGLNDNFKEGMASKKKVQKYLCNLIAEISLRNPLFPGICHYFSAVGGW